jgi:endonuclease-3
MDEKHIEQAIQILGNSLKYWDLPIVSNLAALHRSPFSILISTVLSSRTKDEVTAGATERLMSKAASPEQMLQLPEEQIAELIYPVGFYKTKAGTILHICWELIDRFGSLVPDTIEKLLTLKGVGRKTANLVVSLAYEKEGICVDTHVHRISNRLGYVRTKTPAQTESALREKLPHRYWIDFNTLLVAFGRKICRPISPLCSQCPIRHLCDRIAVTRSR